VIIERIVRSLFLFGLYGGDLSSPVNIFYIFDLGTPCGFYHSFIGLLPF
jgi:hypothetical protein